MGTLHKDEEEGSWVMGMDEEEGSWVMGISQIKVACNKSLYPTLGIWQP